MARISSHFTKRYQRDIQSISLGISNEEFRTRTNILDMKISENSNIIAPIIFKMRGPPDTPYEGGIFNIECKLNTEYPFKAPTMKFLTRVYHPNINIYGDICLNILKHEWSPSLSLEDVLVSITCLLQDPNPDDPLNSEIAREYRLSKEKFFASARAATEKYAMEHKNPVPVQSTQSNSLPNSVELFAGSELNEESESYHTEDSVSDNDF